MTRQRKLGDRGEQIACQHLLKNGYSIVVTQWHCAHGELDIVARQGEMLVFVEVKTRRGQAAEEALSGITARKRERLIKSAQLYLDEHGLADAAWRIDAIAIIYRAGGPPLVQHVEDALDW